MSVLFCFVFAVKSKILGSGITFSLIGNESHAIFSNIRLKFKILLRLFSKAILTVYTKLKYY